MKIAKLEIALIVLVVLVQLGCKEDEGANAEFDRSEMFSNLYSNVIKIEYDEMNSKAKALHLKSLDSSSAPDNDELKIRWKEAAKQWEKVIFLNFGSVDDAFIHKEIYKWPVNKESIYNNLIDYDVELDTTFVKSLGASNKGLGAIEYLLYDSEINALDDSITQVRRKKFIASLAYNVTQNVSTIISLWEVYQSNYAGDVLTGIKSSTNQTLNSIYNTLEFIIYSKVGNPAGISLVFTDTTLLQAPRSEYSIQLIQSNLEMVKYLFQGDTSNGLSLGLDNYSDFYEDEKTESAYLSRAINDQIDECLSITKRIETSLKEAIVSNNVLVKDLYDNLVQLARLFKVDLASRLNVTITVTDNDGD